MTYLDKRLQIKFFKSGRLDAVNRRDETFRERNRDRIAELVLFQQAKNCTFERINIFVIEMATLKRRCIIL